MNPTEHNRIIREARERESNPRTEEADRFWYSRTPGLPKPEPVGSAAERIVLRATLSAMDHPERDSTSIIADMVAGEIHERERTEPTPQKSFGAIYPFGVPTPSRDPRERAIQDESEAREQARRDDSKPQTSCPHPLGPMPAWVRENWKGGLPRIGYVTQP